MRVTYWVDTTSFLLRQLKQQQTSAEWAALADQVRGSDSNRAAAPMLDLMGDAMRASTYLVVFSNLSSSSATAPAAPG